MGLESGDFSLDSDTGIGQAPEQVSEKVREQASSKALAGIARARKDESKGKKASDLLTSILVSLLRNPRFDSLIDPVMTLLRANVPAAYVVGILSLVSQEASSTIRKTYDPSLPLLSSEPAFQPERTRFDPDALPNAFRLRINEWISDIFLVTTKDPSFVLSKKFLSEMSVSKTRAAFVECAEATMVFFFDSKNIEVSPVEARSLSAFLLKELESRVAKLNFNEIP